MNRIKIGTGAIYELTHDVGRNSCMKLEDRDRLPSKVIQDIYLTVFSLRNFSATGILAYLVIPATDG